MKIKKKVIATVLMVATMTVGMFSGSAYAKSQTGTYLTNYGNRWNVLLSSGSIGVNKYSITSLAYEVNESHYYSQVYIDVELYCYGIENPFDEKTVYNKNKTNISVNNSSGGTSLGYGESATNSSDSVYGFGGTIVIIPYES